MDVAALERLARLPAVRGIRSMLREAYGLELTVITPEGPLAHRSGGVMTSSCEACRTSLFTREGFAACDGFYRELAGADGERVRHCHLGLSAVAEAVVLDGDVIARVAASGFDLDRTAGGSSMDPSQRAERLAALDPAHPDPAEAIRATRSLRRQDVSVVRAALRTAAAEMAAAERDRRARHATDGAIPGSWGLVGDSPRMRDVFEQIGRIAPSDSTVLITGESGTGKELVARALVEHGPRKARPFVAQSCGSISEQILESTLFGHVRGAFSGALQGSPGLFGAAEGGTLFLDEVGEMSPSLQVKLLRVLQERTYLPVGATAPRTADVRVIAATHRDLAGMVAAGTFREDLYYRLHVIPLRLPPLRDRPGDVRHLVSAFLAEVDAPQRVSDASWACLERYRFPGNVRELRAEVKRWELSAGGAAEIGPEHLSAPIREAGGYFGDVGGEAAAAAAAGAGTLADAVEALERAIIRRGLERTRGNRTQLAKELDISRTTLADRLARYGLDDRGPDDEG